MSSRIEREMKTIRTMIGIHCRSLHRQSPCNECGALLAYAEKRIKLCPFGGRKPVCSRCSIHCYKPGMRSRIKEVMRYAGPKMIYRHPVLALLHLMDSFRSSRPHSH